MVRKRIGPFVCIIACFFIVNNCQVGHCQLPPISSLIQSILPGGLTNSFPLNLLRTNSFPLNLVSAVLCSISSNLCPPDEPEVEYSDEIRVTYPLIIKSDYPGLNKTLSPPLEIKLKKDDEMSNHYSGEYPFISSFDKESETKIILTGGSLKDGHENTYSFDAIHISWIHKYEPESATYTVGDITNPYGQVEYFFASPSYTPNASVTPACNLFVRIIFYIAVRDDEGQSDPDLENFLNLIQAATEAGIQGVTLAKAEYYFSFPEIFNKPYFLYNNANVQYGRDGAPCATVIVFPENIRISKTDADRAFGSDRDMRPSENKYTPEENNLKKVYLVEPGANTGGLKITSS